MKIILITALILIIFIGCTKDVGKNPELAFSDFALFDSLNGPAFNYYKNSQDLLPGSNGPHGPYKLRFNKIGFNALTDNGKLPVGQNMPNGSLIVKDIYDGSGSVTLHAFMYKRSGSWLWGEIKPDKTILFSVNKNPSICIGCHSQGGNRDMVTTFNFH